MSGDETSYRMHGLDALDFEQLRLAQIRRNQEWGETKRLPLSFRTTELAGEVGELCNVLKKVDRTNLGLVGGRTLQEAWQDICDELADVVICADLIGMHLGVDLSQAVRDKFNKTSAKHDFETTL